MLESLHNSFLNPWAFWAGLLLVSAPVIIHLINRIRYRRVRWAAMEFLLKAQRRMRRKLILQQLLLLLMRMLMVFLAGVMVARFAGCGLSGDETRATAHVVILDDSPSMADGWRAEDGAATDAFEQAKLVLTEQIAKSAAEATTPQTLDVFRPSDLGNPRGFGRLNPTSIDELKSHLAGYKPSTVRVPLADALRKAKAQLDAQGGDVGKVIHVLSDFRAVDWAEEGEAVKEAVQELTTAGVKVFLVDVAHPFRKKDDRRAPLAHDNVGVTDLQPAKLVVARYDPLEFTLRVKNYGTSELKNVRFAIKVNGDENKGRSVLVPTLPGGQERAVKFEVPFDRVGTEEKPLDRFSLVTASLESGEPGGIAADNVRHAVVEVRDRLPILVIEGRPEVKDKTGDGFYLRPVFQTVLSGYQWVDGKVATLEAGDLQRYAFVLLLNVPTLSDMAVKNLEQYAMTGGGVGFFLGPNVQAAAYNKALYRDGAGVFPVPLAEQPSKPLSDEEVEMRRFRISQKKLLVRDPAKRSHPALAGLYTDERGEPVKDAEQLERVFGFISIRQYWPIPRLGKWRQDPTVSELYCMPNEQAMADYEKAAKDVAQALQSLAKQAENEKYKEPLAKAGDDLFRLSGSPEPLYKLAVVLDDVLADQRGDGGPAEALMREFWANPKLADLKSQATRLRDLTKFGDPFYMAKDFGRGRVVLFTTTAGEQWTDWPSEKPGSASFTPVMKEMGNYLAGAGADENRVVGAPITLRLDAGRYKPGVKRAFISHDPAAKGAADPAPVVDLKDQALTPEGDKLVLKFTEATTPGAYLFTLTGLKPQGNTGETTEAVEYRAFAANLDPRESDLRRATRDDVTLNAPKAELETAADGDWVKALRSRRSDLTELVWLFVALFALLVFEQLLSTALSYHASPGELEASAPSAAAVVRRSTAGPVDTESTSSAA